MHVPSGFSKLCALPLEDLAYKNEKCVSLQDLETYVCTLKDLVC